MPVNRCGHSLIVSCRSLGVNTWNNSSRERDEPRLFEAKGLWGQLTTLRKTEEAVTKDGGSVVARCGDGSRH